MTGPVIGRRPLLAGMVATALAGRARAQPGVTAAPTITRYDPGLDRILDANAPAEVLARGYRWLEGPVWIADGGYLLFSDVPANVVHRWTRSGGAVQFLKPSGLQTPIPASIREAGANGMALDRQGRLLLADSGTRAIVRVDRATRRRTILADRYQGKRFNSCNDLVVARDGTIYLTDPPYGLAEGDASPLKEQQVNGVYRLSPSGQVTLVDGSHSRPNGIGLSPDGHTLYLALSDEARPEILAYALGADGMPTGVRRFADFRAELAAKQPGLPDGMDVGADGTVFASAPGGIYVLDPSGKRLGLIATGKPIANCCVGEGGRSLFLTASDTLCRVALRT